VQVGLADLTNMAKQPLFPQNATELEFVVGDIDKFSLLLDELPALKESVHAISIKRNEDTYYYTYPDSTDGRRKSWAPPDGEFWESLAQFTALTYVLYHFAECFAPQPRHKTEILIVK
jgi:hypothetical protein